MGSRRLFWVTCVALGGLWLSAQSFALQESVQDRHQSSRCQNRPCVESGPASHESAQSKSGDRDDPQPVTLKRVFLNLPGDQKAIWTSPFHLRARDLYWVAPLAATAGVLFGSDQHSMARARSNADAIDLSSNISNGGLAALVALPATMYLWGALPAHLVLAKPACSLARR